MVTVIQYFLNILEKMGDLIEIKTKNKVYRFSFSEIEYFPWEVKEIKMKIIDFYLKRLKLNRSYHDHLFHLLFLATDAFHKKVCIIHYLSSKKIPVDEISTIHISRMDIPLLNLCGIYPQKINHRFSIEQIFYSLTLINVLAKLRNFLIQRRIFPESKSRYNSKLKYKKVIRIWEEIAETKYREKLSGNMEDVIVQVNPLMNQLPRQFNHIKQMQKEHINYFCFVPPVLDLNTIKNSIITMLNPYPWELKFPLVDLYLQRLETEKLIKYLFHRFPHIEEIYSMEEFDPRSPYFVELVHKYNKKIINLSHGVGVYSPYVFYDEFYVFSSLQQKYYTGNSKFTIYPFELIKKDNRDIKPKKLAIFFVGQHLLSHYLQRNIRWAYQKAIEFIEEIAKNLPIPVFAKYHPASEKADKILSNHIKIVEKVEDLPADYYYLAVTLHSAYVIELLPIMPFIALDPGKTQQTTISYIFPDTAQIILQDYSKLKNVLEEFDKNYNSYQKYWEDLVSIMSSAYNIKFKR